MRDITIESLKDLESSWIEDCGFSKLSLLSKYSDRTPVLYNSTIATSSGGAKTPARFIPLGVTDDTAFYSLADSSESSTIAKGFPYIFDAPYFNWNGAVLETLKGKKSPIGHDFTNTEWMSTETVGHPGKTVWYYKDHGLNITTSNYKWFQPLDPSVSAATPLNALPWYYSGEIYTTDDVVDILNYLLTRVIFLDSHYVQVIEENEKLDPFLKLYYEDTGLNFRDYNNAGLTNSDLSTYIHTITLNPETIMNTLKIWKVSGNIAANEYSSETYIGMPMTFASVYDETAGTVNVPSTDAYCFKLQSSGELKDVILSISNTLSGIMTTNNTTQIQLQTGGYSCYVYLWANSIIPTELYSNYNLDGFINSVINNRKDSTTINFSNEANDIDYKLDPRRLSTFLTQQSGSSSTIYSQVNIKVPETEAYRSSAISWKIDLIKEDNIITDKLSLKNETTDEEGNITLDTVACCASVSEDDYISTLLVSSKVKYGEGCSSPDEAQSYFGSKDYNIKPRYFISLVNNDHNNALTIPDSSWYTDGTLGYFSAIKDGDNIKYYFYPPKTEILEQLGVDYLDLQINVIWYYWNNGTYSEKNAPGTKYVCSINTTNKRILNPVYSSLKIKVRKKHKNHIIFLHDRYVGFVGNGNTYPQYWNYGTSEYYGIGSSDEYTIGLDSDNIYYDTATKQAFKTPDKDSLQVNPEGELPSYAIRSIQYDDKTCQLVMLGKRPTSHISWPTKGVASSMYSDNVEIKFTDAILPIHEYLSSDDIKEGSVNSTTNNGTGNITNFLTTKEVQFSTTDLFNEAWTGYYTLSGNIITFKKSTAVYPYKNGVHTANSCASKVPDVSKKLDADKAYWWLCYKLYCKSKNYSSNEDDQLYDECEAYYFISVSRCEATEPSLTGPATDDTSFKYSTISEDTADKDYWFVTKEYDLNNLSESNQIANELKADSKTELIFWVNSPTWLSAMGLGSSSNYAWVRSSNAISDAFGSSAVDNLKTIDDDDTLILTIKNYIAEDTDNPGNLWLPLSDDLMNTSYSNTYLKESIKFSKLVWKDVSKLGREDTYYDNFSIWITRGNTPKYNRKIVQRPSTIFKLPTIYKVATFDEDAETQYTELTNKCDYTKLTAPFKYKLILHDYDNDKALITLFKDMNNDLFVDTKDEEGGLNNKEAIENITGVTSDVTTLSSGWNIYIPSSDINNFNIIYQNIDGNYTKILDHDSTATIKFLAMCTNGDYSIEVECLKDGTDDITTSSTLSLIKKETDTNCEWEGQFEFVHKA